MDKQLFDLFLTGHLAVGGDRDRAVRQLAALFKRSEEQVEKLLQGRSSRIRKAIGSAELERLQRGFDKLGILTESRPCPAGNQQQRAVAEYASAANEPLTLCPNGSPVLREQERQRLAPLNIDTSSLSLATPGSRLQDPQAVEAIVPDTGHLQLLAPGDQALSETPPLPTLDHDELCGNLSIAELGSELGSSTAQPPAAAPRTDHLKLG